MISLVSDRNGASNGALPDSWVILLLAAILAIVIVKIAEYIHRSKKPPSEPATVTLSCPCGSELDYSGSNAIGTAREFLEAHEDHERPKP